MRSAALFLILFLMCFVAVNGGRAATLTVTNTASGGAGSLRQAILDAGAGDTIDFDLAGCPCSIFPQVELLINKDLTINGPGADKLTLYGSPDANSSPITRILRVALDKTVYIGGIAFVGGFGSVSGGAIENDGGILTISDSVFHHNSANVNGGAIISVSGTLMIINSTFFENSALRNGGAIASNGTLTVINSTIASNTARISGGGIWNFGTLSVTNTTIVGNIASEGAFGMGSGGGIWAGSNESLANSIVADNAVTITPGNGNASDINGTVEFASHNLISDSATSGGIQNGIDGNIVGNSGIGTLPLQTAVLFYFPSDNGGPVPTILLSPSSPAFNSGDNSLAVDQFGSPLTTDQRGVGFPRILNGIVNIGAVEELIPYSFTGFFRPVDNSPALNETKAGSAVPVKFSIGGNFGLNIFSAGYPGSSGAPCNSSDPSAPIEETSTAGSSGLSYDAQSGVYTYVWKTDKTWKGTCRTLFVKLNDGTSRSASFKFK